MSGRWRHGGNSEGDGVVVCGTSDVELEQDGGGGNSGGRGWRGVIIVGVVQA